MHKPTRAVPVVVAMCVLCCAQPLRAQSGGALEVAYRAAQANEAEYRAARFELDAREQAVPIARAGLLPTISASYAESQVRGERESPNFLGQEFTQTLDYRTPAGVLQLRTPLFNLEAMHRLQSARSQVDGARASFVARGHELLDRVATAYAQRLLSEEVVVLAQAQVDALKGQSDLAERRFVGGEGTRTEVAEASASFAVARVQLIEAIDQRDLAQRTLARITGLDPLPLRALAESVTFRALPYPRVQEWIDVALTQNPNIQARRQLVAAARYEVDRSRAGHLPKVDLVASAVDSRNESISALNQHSRQYSAGIQVSIPIYSGGGVVAAVSQAVADLARIEAQLDGDQQLIAVDIRRQYQAVQSGQAKVEALKEAMESSAVALEGTRRGLVAGVRTNADVLDAVRRFFLQRRDFVQARYEQLLARMRLEALAGLPVYDIVQDLDRHLTAPPGSELRMAAAAS